MKYQSPRLEPEAQGDLVPCGPDTRPATLRLGYHLGCASPPQEWRCVLPEALELSRGND